ncbi:BNR-4 repeat-containing protein [candidate division KSB1 bacterium]
MKAVFTYILFLILIFVIGGSQLTLKCYGFAEVESLKNTVLSDSLADYFAYNGKKGGAFMLNNQSAYYYNGRTYIVYSGTNCDPYIICYDHDTEKYSDIVKLGVTVSIEYHVVPSLLVDNEGYIHIFYGAHNYAGKMTYIRSSEPEDISHWIEMGEISFERGVSYLQSIQLENDSVYVFYRSGDHMDFWGYQISGDGGFSWGPEQNLLDSAKVDSIGWYASFTKGKGDSTIHCGITSLYEGPDNETMYRGGRYNIYYIYRDGDGKWKNVQGDVLTTPLSKSTLDDYALVYNSGTNTCQFPSIGLTPDDNPYLIWHVGGRIGSPKKYEAKFAKWNSMLSKWDITGEPIAITNNLFNNYCIDVIDADTIHAYFTENWTSGGTYYSNLGGRIIRHVSNDSGNTWHRDVYATGADSDLRYNEPGIVRNYTDANAKLIYAECTPADGWNININIDYNAKLYFWGDNGPVKRSMGSSINYKDTTSYLLNSDSPLWIPMYDRSNELIHPDIIFYPDLLNEYKYWLSFVPYSDYTIAKKNPSILASNDSYVWASPDNLTNPVIDTPLMGSNTDPDILYDKNNEEVRIYYIQSHTNNDVTLNFVKSDDTIEWSEPLTIINSDSLSMVSPTIVCRDSVYLMWSVNFNERDSTSQMNTVQIRTSHDGVVWSLPKNCNLKQPNYNIWNIDVIYVSSFKEYWILFTASPKDDLLNNSSLFFARSKDGFYWETFERPLLNKGIDWDNKHIYHATSCYNELNGIWKILYSASSTEDLYQVGCIDISYNELNSLLKPIVSALNANHEFAPEEFKVYQNYPNPFNPRTTIKYELHKVSDINIAIYNILGQKIKTLVDDKKIPGRYQIEWDGTNEYGRKVASGQYIIELRAGNKIHTIKVMFIK